MSKAKMDNSEFEIRVLANPRDHSQDFLDALKEDPSRQQLLDDVKAIDQRLRKSLTSVPIPEGLANQLKAAVRGDKESESNVVVLNRPWYSNRGIALAASLVLALGVTYSVLFNDTGPTAADLAFSQQVMEHVYMELDEIGSQANLDYQMVNSVLGVVGAQMRTTDSMDNLNINFAKPCFIIPQTRSAHLALVGNQGVVNIIVVSNSPVQSEFSISDDRFTGVVIPIDGGNLILVGEKQESLNNYRELLAENVDWII